MSDLNYFLTYTGKKINIETLSEDDICLEDIAHGLTTYKRYGGSLSFKYTYNVANHSCLMAEYVLDITDKIGAAKLALMHDAAEAYLGDMPSPIKEYLPDYKRLEAKFTEVIFKKYIIKNNAKYEKLVEEVDKRIVLDETASLRPKYYNDYRFRIPSNLDLLGISVKGDLSLEKSKFRFLDWCEYLGIKD